MKSQPPKKDVGFFIRTPEEIILGLSAKEAL